MVETQELVRHLETGIKNLQHVKVFNVTKLNIDMQFFLNENLNDHCWNHRLQLTGKFLLGDRASFF